MPHMAETGARERAAGWARRGGCLLILTGIAVGLLAASSFRHPLLVWNASASSPRGLYLVSAQSPVVGDFVIAWPPPNAESIAHDRRYLRAGVPLVKTVAAGAGDHICAEQTNVWVNAGLVAERLPADRAGRALPWWAGCRTLGQGELLLLGRESPMSFDGRYFGPTTADRVVGRARLLWPA